MKEVVEWKNGQWMEQIEPTEEITVGMNKEAKFWKLISKDKTLDTQERF